MKKLVLVMSVVFSMSSFASCETEVTKKIESIPQVKKALIKVEAEVNAGQADLSKLNDLYTLTLQAGYVFCDALKATK